MAIRFTLERLMCGVTDTHQSLLMNKFRNPFGVGNFINHPPQGTQPNCMNVAYNFPSIETHEHYLSPSKAAYIPNVQSERHYLYPIFNCLVPSVVILTTAHVRDEELFMNYRFNPENKNPDWYHQPNDEEAQRRWAKPKLFKSFL